MELYIEVVKDKKLAKLLAQFRLGIISGFDKLPKNIQDIITLCSVRIDPDTEHELIVILQIEIKTVLETSEQFNFPLLAAADKIAFQNGDLTSLRWVKGRVVKKFSTQVLELINHRIKSFEEEIEALKNLLPKTLVYTV